MDMGQGTMMNDPSQPLPPMMGGGEGGMDPMALAAQSQPPAGGPMAQMGAPEFMQGPENTDPMQKYMDFALSQANLAKFIRKKKDGEDTLAKMGEEVVRGYDEDQSSREDWMKNNKKWMELALLVTQNKTYPWPRAANIKYPLIATAAMQFSARAYPSLVPSDGRIVKTRLPQKHKNKALLDASMRIANHMSFQIKYIMDRWEEDQDKLLMAAAITGICFKKTYYDGVEKKNKSVLVYPENLVVNYWAKSLETAYRKTELLFYTKNDISAKVNNDEEFLDVLEDLKPADVSGSQKEPVANKTTPPAADSATPHVFLSQHTFWDLDDDGYEEPYVITVHRDSKKVVRVVARWDEDGVTRNADGDIIHIKPVEYFTDFPFIPNPDGSIYALGFGALLGPLNVSVNTLINQLIDSGTLNNLQGGLIGKGLRIKMGESGFKPGEWKVVNATGDDISKSVFPIPTKEPSGVLFNLLNMLIQSGNQLASIAEIFVGKMPGQNTPATTTQETVQQSMAVFTAIYKRMFRALESEFRKLYRLNRLNPETLEEETKLAGVQLSASDYDNPEWVVAPAADPAGDNATLRQQKLQFIAQALMPLGTINPQVYTQKSLEMLDLSDAEEWSQPPPPPQPDPKAQMAQAKMQADQQKTEAEMAMLQEERASKREDHELKKELEMMKIALKEREAQMDLAAKERDTKLDAVIKMVEMQHLKQSRDMDLQHQAVAGRQKILQNEESFRQKQQQQKQTARKSNNGSRAKN